MSVAQTPQASGTQEQFPAALQANYALGLMFAAYILSFIDRQVLGVMIGPIKADLQLTDFQFSLLQGAAFAVLYSIAALPFGRWSDIGNRKVIMGAGVLGWSLTTIGCGLTKTFPQLFVMRMAVGVGEAALSPAAYSTISDSYPRHKLPRAMAIYKSGMIVGGGLALILGGRTYDYYASIDGLSLPFYGPIMAWQATFITFGLPGILVAALIFLTREPTRKGKLQGENQTDITPKVSRVMHYMFVEHRQLYISIFIGCSLLGIVTYGYSSWFTEMLIRNFDLTRSQAGARYGYTIITAGFIGILSGPSFVRFFEKRGHTNAPMRALLIFALAVLPAAVAAPLMPQANLALTMVSVLTFFQAAYVGIAAAALQIVTPNQMRGQATAVYIFATNMLGLAIGSSVVAGVTDFVFADDAALNLSLSLVSAILVPMAAFLFWRGLHPFATAIKQSENWSS
jgi:MFS family permease